METLKKPQPRISEGNRPYFDGARAGKLRIQRCGSCGQHIFFPREACPHCLAADPAWVDASGLGAVYSFCVVHRPQDPSFYNEVPILFAAIKLAEGPVMLSEVRGIAPDKLTIGASVRVAFTPISDEVSIPVWVPVET